VAIVVVVLVVVVVVQTLLFTFSTNFYILLTVHPNIMMVYFTNLMYNLGIKLVKKTIITIHVI